MLAVLGAGTDAVGLGPDGIGSRVKGDTLTTCDIDGDGLADIKPIARETA